MQETPLHESLTPARTRLSRHRNSAVECACCGLYGLCQVAGLGSFPAELVDDLVSRRVEVAAGRTVIRAGEHLDEIIAVRSGSFTLTTPLADGNRQLAGFVLPGELIGLEQFGEGEYPFAVESLEKASICRFSLSRLYLLDGRMGEFQHQLIRALGRQVRTLQSVPLMMGAKSAEQRMALFLLDMSSRLSEHGFPWREFRLPMSRRCIADYLGLAMETVSRIFKRFHARELISVRSRQVALRDMPRLREVAGMEG